MEYITDIHALNLECDLGTTGDWHASAIRWEHPRTLDTGETPWGDWGIEVDSDRWVPGNPGRHNIANHVRALCDMVYLGRLSNAQGMSEVFLDGDEYDEDIFEHIYMLRETPRWAAVNEFMGREYGRKWVSYRREKEHERLA